MIILPYPALKISLVSELISLILKIAEEHPAFRPEICSIISDLICLNPVNMNSDIRIYLIKSLVHLIWSQHPDTSQTSSDGVAFDILRTITKLQSPQMKFTFQQEILKATSAPYSPGFSKELGAFLVSNDFAPTNFGAFQKSFFHRFSPSHPKE